MATVTATVDTSSDERIYDTSKTIVGASAGNKQVTGFSVTWDKSYIGNYSDSSTSGCHIYFKINGVTAATITYTTTSRPAISVSNLNITIAPNTAIVLTIERDFNSFIGGDESRKKWIHIRGSISVNVTYDVISSHPTVSAGSLITADQMVALYYYKYGSSATPGQGNIIQPWIFGSAGSQLKASDYNGA